MEWRKHLAEQARERMKAGGGDKKSKAAKEKSGVETFPQAIKSKGKTRDKTGELVGVSGKSVDKAATIAEFAPDAAEAVMKMGGELAQARDKLAKHGNGTFGKWCVERCGISVSLAWKTIKATEQFQDRVTVTQSFDATAMYLLSAESCPEDTRDEFIERAETGEQMIVYARMPVDERAKTAAPLAEPNTTNRHNRSVDNVNARPTGNSGDYLTRRIARDRPDILERMKAGEFPSVRQAAIEAGIVKVKTPLEVAKAAYLKLADRDRRAFRLWMDNGLPDVE